MPYISAEETKVIRKELKKTFPEIKFSVRKEDNMAVRVVILEAPYFHQFNGKDAHVNQYHIKNYVETDKDYDVLRTIKNIVSKEQKELVYDSDYGSVPNYYITIRIGDFDRPFIYKS